MEKDIEELKSMMGNKVDCSLFESEIESLKDLINQLGSSGNEIKVPIVSNGSSISSKELNNIREALKKVAEHEIKLKGLDLDSIMKRLLDLESEVSKKAEIEEMIKLLKD